VFILPFSKSLFRVLKMVFSGLSSFWAISAKVRGSGEFCKISRTGLSSLPNKQHHTYKSFFIFSVSISIYNLSNTPYNFKRNRFEIFNNCETLSKSVSHIFGFYYPPIWTFLESKESRRHMNAQRKLFLEIFKFPLH